MKFATIKSNAAHRVKTRMLLIVPPSYTWQMIFIASEKCHIINYLYPNRDHPLLVISILKTPPLHTYLVQKEKGQEGDKKNLIFIFS